MRCWLKMMCQTFKMENIRIITDALCQMGEHKVALKITVSLLLLKFLCT